MQFINAAAGGTIYGDLSDHIATDIEHSPKRGGTHHTIEIDAASHIGQALGADSLAVNTYHLQSLETVGAGLRLSRTAPTG